MVEEESPMKSLHFLLDGFKMLMMVSFNAHCLGWSTGSIGVFALVPPHPDTVEALPGKKKASW